MKARLILGIVALVIAKIVAPRLFEPESINSILLWLPLILTVALGEFLVVVAGGIDISVGAILGFTAMTVGVTLKAKPDLPVPLAFLFAVLIGLALGSINGLLVAKAKLPPLIVTIGTLATYRGLAFLVAGGQTITASSIPDSLLGLSNHGLPLGSVTVSFLAIISLLVLGAIGWFATNHPSGRAIFAYGGQPEGAIRRGISRSGVQLLVFSLCGALSGLAGAMYLARFGQVQPGSAGVGFELTVIATVAIAGTKLTGGAGSILALTFSAIFVSALNVGLSTLGINEDWQMLLYGLVLLVMVCADGYRRRKEVLV